MSAEFSELKALQARVEKELSKAELNKFYESTVKYMSQRFLRMVKQRTPTGDYSGLAEGYTNKMGGTLKKAWKVGHVHRAGVFTIVEVKNPIKYASYVEYGHRQTPGRYVPALGKRLKASWVDGQFFMTKSEKELNRVADGIVKKRFEDKLSEVFNGK